MIRAAARHELARLSELALRSKAVWGYSAAFMAACRDELTLRPDELAELFVLEIESKVAGFYSLQHVSDGEVELGYLFVEPAEMRKGYGMALLRDAVSRARAAGYARLSIQGDPNAIGFYRAAGARQIGERESDSVPGRMLPVLEIALGD